MEKKIIELTKCREDHQCIICCQREATTKVNIQRLVKVNNDSLIIFFVCDECLARMQDDIQKICEQQVFCFVQTIQNDYIARKEVCYEDTKRL